MVSPTRKPPSDFPLAFRERPYPIPLASRACWTICPTSCPTCSPLGTASPRNAACRVSPPCASFESGTECLPSSALCCLVSSPFAGVLSWPSVVPLYREGVLKRTARVVPDSLCLHLDGTELKRSQTCWTNCPTSFWGSLFHSSTKTQKGHCYAR